MRERISREQFETTERGRGLETIDGLIAEFRKHGLCTVENGNLRRLDFETEFPAELQHGFANFLQTREKPSLLDVGGGEGKIAIELMEKVPRLRAVVIDLYPPQKTATPVAHARPNIFYIRTDFDRGPLPVQEQSADLCVSSRVSLYLDNPLELINEMIRATRPGGYIVVDGINRLYVVPESRAVYENENIMFHIPSKDNLQFFYNASHHDYTIIRVNNPKFRIADFEILPHHLTKEGKFRAATEGMGTSFGYKKLNTPRKH